MPARHESAHPRPPMVRVDALGRRFDTVTALDDLRFTVAPGELFGLVGPDGAGKTTCLRKIGRAHV